MPDNTLFNPLLGMGGGAFAQRHPAFAQQHPGLLPGGAPTPAPGTPVPAPGMPVDPNHGGAQQWADQIQQYHNQDGGWNIAGLQSAMGNFHSAVNDWRGNRPNGLAGGARNPAYMDWMHQRPSMWNYLHPQTPGTPAAPGTPAVPGATPPLTNPGTQVGPVNALPQTGNVGSSYGVIGANPAANPYGLPTY